MLKEVSDTARELIKFKAATTTIAKAKETASYFNLNPTVEDLEKFSFWTSVVHFEMRYRSLDYFIEKKYPKNILELSAGFSFRGLELCQKNKKIEYWDTDLPNIMNIKKSMLLDWGVTIPKNLHLQSLNATQSNQYPTFDSEVLIINEGLLMYFSFEEKRKILHHMHNMLSQHGGTWVTADIYINHNTNVVGSDSTGKWHKFFQRQQVYNNYFESFDQAAQFFNDCGFEIVEKYNPEFDKLSSVPSLFEHASPEQLEVLKTAGRVQETWQLKAK